MCSFSTNRRARAGLAPRTLPSTNSCSKLHVNHCQLCKKPHLVLNTPQEILAGLNSQRTAKVHLTDLNEDFPCIPTVKVLPHAGSHYSKACHLTFPHAAIGTRVLCGVRLPTDSRQGDAFLGGRGGWNLVSPTSNEQLDGKSKGKIKSLNQLLGLVNADVKISVPEEKSCGSGRDKWEGVGRL